MAEGAVETSKARPGEVLLQGRIEFQPARRPLSASSARAGGDLRGEALNPGYGSHRPAAWSGATSSSSAAAAAGRRSDGGEFHQRGLDPELSFEITFRRIGAGLANLGNTCFLNSVLQCLTYTEPFAAYLQSGKHKSSCRTAGFCAMCALQSHVMDALQSTGKILTPFHLVKNLRSISRNFRISRQEDAHEYMVNLLESMHKCCLPSGIASESPSAYEKSLVHKIFGGRLRSQVKCLQCSYCSNKFDPFLDLSLEIMKADTLHKALSHFTAVEQLDGGEKQYQCQRCKQKVRAVKQLTIHKAPYVLTVHLKRFGSALPGQKIDKKVDFEPTLYLKRYVSDPCEGDLKYTLYGVLVHAGYATHSGHYYCFVRTSSGTWYSLNDDEVFQVSEKTVLQQKAYMLFYVRNMRSSAPKRALDFVCKEKRLANAFGSKDPSFCSLASKKANLDCPRECGTKRAIQDCPRENGSKQCNPIPKSDASSLGVPMPGKDISVEEHLPKKTSISPGLMAKDCQKSNLPEDCIFSSLSKISSIKEPSATVSLLSSAISERLVAEALMERASSRDNRNQTFGKDLVQSAVSKEKTVCAVSSSLVQSAPASGNLVAANSLVEDCRVTLASAQSSRTKDDLTTGSIEDVDKSSILVMRQAKGNAILNPPVDNSVVAKSLVKDCTVAPASAQTSHMKGDLTTDSTVDLNKFHILVRHARDDVILNPDPKKVLTEAAMHEKYVVQNMMVQVNHTSCKARSLLELGQATLSHHPSTIGSLHELRIAHVQCQDATVNDGTSNGPVAAEVQKNISKESEQVTPGCCSQKDSVGCTEFDQLVMKQKVQKHSHMRNMKFGPRRLFLAYLNLVKKNAKKKKHQRIMKRYLNIKGKKAYETLEDNIDGDQGTSTSISFLDVGMVLSTKKKFCKGRQRENGTVTDTDLVHSTRKFSSLGRKNGRCGAEDVNVINSGSISTKESDDDRRYVKNSAETILKSGQHGTGAACTISNSHHVSRNLSMSSSAEVTVPQWSNVDSTCEVASISDDEPKSIGYMLEEWGKECNRGKKKKVKRSRRFFGGGNHFRDVVALRTQKKMKMDQTSSGNKPFRIHG